MKADISRYSKLLITMLFASLISCQGAAGTPGDKNRKATPLLDASPTTSLTTNTIAAPTGTPLPQPTQPGASGLTGLVVSASDVAGQEDTPLASQMVLAVRLERAGEVLGASGEALTEKGLRFLKASLPQADPAIAVTLTDAAGKYTLPLDPGEYVLCLADSDKTPPDFPATTRGCGRTQVWEGQMRRVDISSGFGEILLVEKD